MADEKPAILRDTTFTVEEGFAYRAFRTLSIWTNKLFFSSVVLLGLWLLWAYAGGETGCADSRVITGQGNQTVDQPAQHCSPFLTPTATYLGAMSVLSFLASIAFGGLGLLVGKKVVESTPSQEEVGAQGAPPAPGSEGDGQDRTGR